MHQHASARAPSCDNFACPGSDYLCQMYAGEPKCVKRTTCANASCREDQRCVIERNLARCERLLSYTCDDVVCGKLRACSVQEGRANCSEEGGKARCVTPKPTCVTLKCGRGQACTESGGGARCFTPKPTCATLSCGLGQKCSESSGEARCYTPIPPKPTCATLRCSSGQKCSMSDGKARCVTAPPATCSELRCSAWPDMLGLGCDNFACSGSDYLCQMYAGEPKCVKRTTCANASCREDQRCVIERNLARCERLLSYTCDDVVCGKLRACSVQEGRANCSEEGGKARCVTPKPTCVTLKCGRGQACTESGGGARCFTPKPTCATLSCGLGQKCSESSGEARCYTPIPPKPTCATLRCSSGQKCSMSDGKARCVTAPPATGSELRCSAGQTCSVSGGRARCQDIPDDFCGLARCQRGQACSRAGAAPRCVASCKSIGCPENSCTVQGDVATCGNCNLRCPPGRVCHMIGPYDPRSLLLTGAQPRCVRLGTGAELGLIMY
ncbi:spore coat protein SP87-like [Pollicipes pollicipes]|uniref:spore coat protein SP87-like n=1 Tax=Pollicipes pollicipes TaxID=41117 RepID=UPI0018856348|nr:spore coat protein SP87-like [Pollicipes pollicipes]